MSLLLVVVVQSWANECFAVPVEAVVKSKKERERERERERSSSNDRDVRKQESDDCQSRRLQFISPCIDRFGATCHAIFFALVSVLHFICSVPQQSVCLLFPLPLILTLVLPSNGCASYSADLAGQRSAWVAQRNASV